MFSLSVFKGLLNPVSVLFTWQLTSGIGMARVQSGWRCPVPTYGNEHAFFCAAFDLRISRLPRPYEPIRVPAGVHVKSDDLSAVVDPIDYGRANALMIIDRCKASVVEGETMHETRRVHVNPNDFVMIVQSECLCER